jgi:DNA invertase Pin-like site-specific DNA recombinase
MGADVANGKFISYLRVSTDAQGRSGLGLEAQQAAVANYLNGGSWELAESFVEIESGKNSDRPELAKALAACKKHRAVLVVAKLDRLSRSVAFLARLLEANVEFVACDNPHANKLMVHMLAAFAEHERDQISARTKAALAAAKARGVKLGGPKLAEAQAKGQAAQKADADSRAANVLPVIREIQAAGVTSLNAIAQTLNARGVQTPRGGHWFASSVKNLLSRADGRAE